MLEKLGGKTGGRNSGRAQQKRGIQRFTRWIGGVCVEARNYRVRKWREDCWARIFASFREYNLQRLQSKQE